LAAHALSGTKPNYEVDVRLSALAGGRPRFPKDLSPESRRTFKMLCRLLQERRQLTPADGEVIRLYCLALERHKHATQHLAVEGEVRMYTRLDSNSVAHAIEKPNLWIKIAESSEKFMLSTLTALGLTMTSRDRVKQVKPEGDDEAVIPGSIEDMRRQGLLGNVVSIAAPIVDLTEEIEKEEEKDDGDNAVD
jgi:P27 family predicted phage terminase small subunit